MKYLILCLAVCPFFATAQSCYFNDGGDGFNDGAAAFNDGQTCEKPPLSIYPNPTTDLLNLSKIGLDTEGVIFDGVGRRVYISNLKDIGVSNLASGVYFLTLLPSKTNLKFVKL